MVRENRQNLQHGKFLLDIRKNSFTVREVKKLQQMPREVLKSPSLEILQTQLDKVQWNLFQAGPVLNKELDQMLSKDPFQPVSFCDYETFISNSETPK